MMRYLYRVELLSEPAEDVHTGRLVYMSLSGAQYRWAKLRVAGIPAAIERSNLITWPEAVSE